MHGTLRDLADVRLRVIVEHRGSHLVKQASCAGHRKLMLV